MSLLRRYAPDYVSRHSREAVPQVQSTLAKLSLCRTAALGGHRYRCGSCDSECLVYNSCGDRHCPQCSGARRADWLDATAELLLPDIDYFQVVFTIPDQLSSLSLGNRRPICELLFQSAWQSLRTVIEEEQEFEPSAAMVLHTWNQKLEPHIHIHAVVPGGGPSRSGERHWVRSCRRDAPHLESAYLVNADMLRRQFRDTFLQGLRRLHRRGELKLEGGWSLLQSASAFETWLKPMETVSWVTYIEPPPAGNSSPEHVLKYLARYLTGGPISDRRLISHEHGHVTFLARSGTTSGGGNGECLPHTVTGIEFVRRWSQHILPKGFVKTRRYGGYSPRHCQRYLAECRELLATPLMASVVPPTEPAIEPSVPPDTIIAMKSVEPQCPKCGKPMLCISTGERPGWHHVMNGEHRPKWYIRYDSS